MSVISAGTTTTTAFKVTGDTTGTLQLQTGAVPTTAIDISATQVVTFPATTTLNFTGTLLLGDGSAAAPTLAHSGDTNTGIYFPGADQIAITTAGTQRVYVGATGDVGIGTSSPAGIVEVSTNASGDAIVTSYNSASAGTTAAFTVRRARGTAASPSAVLIADALGGLYARGYKATAFSGNTGVIRFEAAENWTDTANGTYITFAATPIGATSRTEYMRLDASGNLGIGTSSPISKLQVAGQVRISGLSAGNTALVIPAGDILGDVSSGAFAIGNYGDASSEMRISTRGFTTFRTGATDGTNGTERMRLDSSGNLGVGVTSITAGFRGLFVGDSAANHITVGVRNTNTTGISRLVLGNDAGLARFTFGYTGSTAPAPFGASLGYIGTEAAEPMLFQTNGSERARITSTGILSINESSPSANYRLYTNGAAFSTCPFSSYTPDGIFNANARPTTVGTPSAATLRLGYQDDGGGQYNPAIGFRAPASLGSGQTDYSNIIWSTTNGALAFGTGTAGSYTERARITNGGTFLVGTATGAYTAAGCINSEVSTQDNFCFSGVNINATNPRGLYLRNTNTTAGDYAIYFEASAATKFYVNGNGVIYSTNTSVQSVSDARHKENVRDLDKGLAEVLALKPRRFDWKEGKGTGAKDVAGFIAQEVETVLPELVGEWKESVDAEETFKSIGMANVIPMLVKAIQELSAKVAALESK